MSVRLVHPERESPALYLNWHHNLRRSETIAEQLGCPVAYVHVGLSPLPAPIRLPLRYLAQAWQSWRLLEARRPRVVVVTNPPVFAPLLAWAWTRVRGRQLVLDNHSGTFLDPHWKWAIPLHHFLARRALFSWVLNPDEEAMTLPHAPESVRLVPDGIPSFAVTKTEREAGNPFTVVAICAGWENEPVDEILEAARSLPEVHFLLTGDSGQLPERVRERAGENVRFTGYLRGEAYTECLRGSDLALVLSKRNDLSAGAFEAVGMGLPLVLARWPNPQQFFCRGAVFVALSGGDIARGIQEARADYARLREEVERLREERRREWRENFQEVAARIESQGAPLVPAVVG